MNLRVYIQGIGMLVGMIFGAGVFALPASIAKAGIWWGSIHFFLAFFVVLFLHLLYGEIIFYIPGKHRITGYVEMLLGSRAKFIAFLFTLFSYYGTLLVYAILGGIFLFNAFSFFTPFVWSTIFLILGAFFSGFNFQKIGSINFYLSIPLFVLIIVLAFLAAPHIKADNFLNLDFFATPFWFLPYGVFIFSLGGFSVVPEVKDILEGHSLRDFKKIIKISSVIIAVSYLIFILSIIGVSGAATSDEAFAGVTAVLGGTVIKIGLIIGLLAFFTSFIALTSDLKSIFQFDYKISYGISWIFTILPVPILFFLISKDFISIIAMIGAIGLGIFGVFVLFMAKEMKKRLSERNINTGLLFLPSFIVYFIIFALFAASVYEAAKILFF